MKDRSNMADGGNVALNNRNVIQSMFAKIALSVFAFILNCNSFHFISFSEEARRPNKQGRVSFSHIVKSTRVSSADC